MTADEIKKMLLDQIEVVVPMLLPGGKRSGPYWECGDITGKRGESLRVSLTGAKKGVWSDFAEKSGGDIFVLWQQAKGFSSFRETMMDVKRYLGITETRMSAPSNVTYTAPDLSKKKELSEIMPVAKYLKGRGIHFQTLHEAGVSAMVGGKKPAMCFAYHDPDDIDGPPCMLKFIDCELNDKGKKVVSVTPGSKKTLFGLCHPLVRHARGVLLICEGEIDALSWLQADVPAVSVPFGAKHTNKEGKSPNDEWIATCYEWLSDMHTIYISMDMDEEGQAAARDLIKRLGNTRCRLVRLPRKDANECLMNGLLSPADAERYLAEADTLNPDDIFVASDKAENVFAELAAGPISEQGIPWLGWNALEFRLRPREGTLITGYSGGGKTTMIRHLIVWLALVYDLKIFVGSYEDKATLYLAKCISVAFGTWLKNLTPEQKQQARDRLLCNIIVHHVEGTVKLDQFIDAATFAAGKYGVYLAVLDNITCSDVKLDDKDACEIAAKKMMHFWKSTGVHLLTIFHPRKPDKNKENGAPGKHDIRGPVVFSDLFGNMLAVHRNDDDTTSVEVGKQREGGSMRSLSVLFDPGSQQFMLDGESPRNYFDAQNEEDEGPPP